MSGTERQDVSNDYAQRIAEGHAEVEAGVAMSLRKLAGTAAGLAIGLAPTLWGWPVWR
jgi:hypothetical protein